MKKRIRVILFLTIFLFSCGLVIMYSAVAAITYTFTGKVFLNGELLKNKNVKVEVIAKFCCMSEIDQGCWNVNRTDNSTNIDGKYYISFQQAEDGRSYRIRATYGGGSTGWIYTDLSPGTNTKYLYIKTSTQDPPGGCPPGKIECEPGVCINPGQYCP